MQEHTDEDADDVELSDNQNQKSCPFYPPSGKGFTDMVTYQLENKRIPWLLSRRQTHDVPSALEEKCFSCGHSISGPYQITERAMTIDVMNVKTGIPKLAVFSVMMEP